MFSLSRRRPRTLFGPRLRGRLRVRQATLRWVATDSLYLRLIILLDLCSLMHPPLNAPCHWYQPWRAPGDTTGWQRVRWATETTVLRLAWPTRSPRAHACRLRDAFLPVVRRMCPMCRRTGLVTGSSPEGAEHSIRKARPLPIYPSVALTLSSPHARTVPLPVQAVLGKMIQGLCVPTKHRVFRMIGRGPASSPDLATRTCRTARILPIHPPAVRYLSSPRARTAPLADRALLISMIRDMCVHNECTVFSMVGRGLAWSPGNATWTCGLVRPLPIHPPRIAT